MVVAMAVVALIVLPRRIHQQPAGPPQAAALFQWAAGSSRPASLFFAGLHPAPAAPVVFGRAVTALCRGPFSSADRGRSCIFRWWRSPCPLHYARSSGG